MSRSAWARSRLAAQMLPSLTMARTLVDASPRVAALPLTTKTMLVLEAQRALWLQVALAS